MIAAPAIAVALALAPAPVPAPPPLALDGQLAFRAYGPRDGLTNTTISGIAQDADGLLWVGSENGLFRWDGRRFTRFGHEDGLPANLVTRVVAAPDGRVWVGTHEGLAVVERGRPRALDAASGLPEGERIVELAVDGEGRVLAGVAERLYRQGDGGRFAPVPGLTGRVGSVWRERDGSLLVYAGAALWHLAPGRAPVVVCPGPDVGGLAIETIARDGAGRLWLRKGQYLFEVLGGRLVDRSALMQGGASWGGLTVDPAGRLWIPAADHVVVVAGDAVDTLSTARGLPAGGSFFKVFHDREGAAWIGGIGLYRQLGRGVWTSHGEAEGLPSPIVWQLDRGPDGVLWAASERGLARLDGARWRPVAGGEGEVEALAITPAGRVWFGATSDDGVRALDPLLGVVRSYGPLEGYRGGSARRLAVDAEGTLWIVPYAGGLWRARGDDDAPRFEPALPRGLPEGTVLRDLALDARGVRWLAGETGLWRVDAGGARRFGVADGLRADALNLVLLRADGEVCVAYATGRGASCFRDAGDTLAGVRHLDVDSGLGSSVVWTLGEDAAARLWVATDRGVTVFGPGGPEWFTVDEGLPADDFAEASFHAEAEGDVWLGSASGLAHFHAARWPGPLPSPTPMFTSVRLGPLAVGPGAATELAVAHHQGSLDARFAVPAFAQEAAVIPEVRLAGLDDAWQPLEVWDVRYPSLPPGDYRLELRVRAGKAAPSPVVALAFVVRPAWWQTWPARAAALAALAAVMALVVRWRVRALRERLAEAQRRQREIEVLNEELRRQVAERSRELATALTRLSSGTTEAVELAPGQVVDDRWTVEEKVGQGAMGTVYRVRRVADGRAFGLKVLTNVVSTRQLARFAREAQIAAQLAHANVVSVVDVGFASAGYMYVVMEYVEGASLKACRERWLDLGFALPVLRDVAAGLAALHAHGIVHRDLKPANVLVGSDGRGRPVAKIVDFGVSWLASGDGADGMSSLSGEPAADAPRAALALLPDGAAAPPAPAPAAAVTAPDERTAATAALSADDAARAAQQAAIVGRLSSIASNRSYGQPIVGTPAYLGPELARDPGAVTPALDVFAFGVMATELLTGRRPFPESPCLALARGHAVEPAAPLRVPGVPAALSELLHACVALAPERRPAAAALVEALEAALRPAAGVAGAR